MKPSLSVVVVTVYSSAHLYRCLAALESQVDAPEDMEIIAVFDERVEDVAELEKKFVSVKFHSVLGLQTQERLRAIGTGLAHGRIVALTVDHCTPEKNWCACIMEAQSGPYAGVGGGYEKGDQPETAINWAVHIYDYCNYGYYQNPVQRGPTRKLSDGNVSYKQEALFMVAEHWKESFHVPFVNWALLERGETLWLSPDIVAYQNRDIGLGRALKVAYRRGRVFASRRISNSTLMKRIFYIFSSSLLPFLFLARLSVNLHRKRSHIRAIGRSIPLIVILAMLWSLGELLGYITGYASFKMGETYD